MKCPHCGETLTVPHGQEVHIVAAFKGVDIITITGPHCQATLGAVNKPKD